MCQKQQVQKKVYERRMIQSTSENVTNRCQEQQLQKKVED